MALITYTDKETMNENPEIPAKNKAQSGDFNNIKTSVNGLFTALGLHDDTYDSTSTYAVGDLVIYDNSIYECTTAITTAEAWDSSKWALVPVIVNE